MKNYFAVFVLLKPNSNKARQVFFKIQPLLILNSSFLILHSNRTTTFFTTNSQVNLNLKNSLMKKLLTTLLLLHSSFLILHSAELETKLMSDPALSSVHLYPQEITEDVSRNASADFDAVSAEAVSAETYEMFLGEGMGFLATTNEPVSSNLQSALSTEQSEIITNFEYSKQYPRASQYVDAQEPFYFSHFRSVYNFIKDKKNSEASKEPYYWELNQYLKGRPVLRENFRK